MELSARLKGFLSCELNGNPYSAVDPVRLFMYLKNKRPELFFSPGYNAPFGKPCDFVFSVHDLNHIAVKENRSLLKTTYYKHVLLPAIHNARVVLTVSEFSRKEILRWSGVSDKKVVSVRQGISQLFRPDGEVYRRSRPYFLYVGTDRPHKNLERMIRAFDASGASKECDFVITGLLRPRLQKLVTELNISQYVHSLGGVSDEKLAALYRGAVCLVFASLYEGFGLPIVEAMACGTPVLTANVASMPEVAGDAALLADPYNVDELGSGMMRILRDAGGRKEMIASGIKRASHYKWEEAAGFVQTVLDDRM